MFKRNRASLLEQMIESGRIHMVDGDGGAGGSGSGGAGDAGGAGDGAGAGDAGGAGGAGGAGAGDGAGDGKPNDDTALLVKDVMKHKTRAKEYKAQVETLTSEVAQLKAALGGLTPDEVQAMIKANKDRERTEAEKRGDYDRIVQQMRDENAAAISSKDSELAARESRIAELTATIEDMTVGREFSEASYIRDFSVIPPGIARKEFGAYFDTVDGKVVGFDKPRGSANRTPLVDASGNPKPFNDAIKQLYERHPDSKSLIKSAAKPGAGSGSVDRAGAGAGAGDENLTGRERIRAALGKRK